MIHEMDVALYILSLDKNHELFTKKLHTQHGRTFYEGNVRLNEYLHLAQNIHIAKYGKPLIDSVFYTYDDGAVAPHIQESYSVLLECRGQEVPLPEKEKKFLNTIYRAFRNATLDDLIELSHEDSEWIDKYGHYPKESQKMNSLARVEEYVEQYADMIKVLERMQAQNESDGLQ